MTNDKMIDEIVAGTRVGGNVIQEFVEENRQSGKVFHAKNERLDNDVTVHIRSDDQDPETFKRIAQASAKVSHPNIRQVYDGSFGGNSLDYVTVARCDYRLSDLIARGEKLESSLVLRTLIQTVDGISCANDFGIYHGDLEAEDIFYDSCENIKIGRLNDTNLGNTTFNRLNDLYLVGELFGKMCDLTDQGQDKQLLERVAMDSLGGKYSSLSEVRQDLILEFGNYHHVENPVKIYSFGKNLGRQEGEGLKSYGERINGYLSGLARGINKIIKDLRKSE